VSRKHTVKKERVPPAFEGRTVLELLKDEYQLSNRQIQKAFRTGGVFVDGRRAHSKQVLQTGQMVKFSLPANQQLRLEPVPMELQVLYEGEELLAIDKPEGVLVHPSRQSRSQAPTLSHGVADYLQRRYGHTITPRPVHRLDASASGIILFALTSQLQHHLTEIWNTDQVLKKYWALVDGELMQYMDLKDPIDGKPAHTKVYPVRSTDGITEVEVQILSGRPHQIRLHLQQAGHPILGDSGYGSADAAAKAERLCLHAEFLQIHSPEMDLDVSISSAPPAWHEVLAGSVEALQQGGTDD